jgi:hypothetical protein
VTFVSGVLTDRANKAFTAAGGVDTDKVEDLSFVKVTFGAAEITHSQLFDLIGLDTHE